MSAGFWLLLALAAIVSPLSVVLSVLLSAVIHECAHLALLRLFRVPVDGLRLTALGAELYARGVNSLSYGRELLVTLAGPLGNLLAAFAFAFAALYTQWEGGYLLAGANILLGAYNLLPIPPLDGGRVVYLVTAFFFGPMVGDAAAAVVGTMCALLLLGLGLHISVLSGSGMFFLFAALALFAGVLPQLRLAKNAVKV